MTALGLSSLSLLPITPFASCPTLQKRRRLELSLESHQKEIKALGQAAGRLHVELQRVNGLIAQNAGAREALAEVGLGCKGTRARVYVCAAAGVQSGCCWLLVCLSVGASSAGWAALWGPEQARTLSSCAETHTILVWVVHLVRVHDQASLCNVAHGITVPWLHSSLSLYLVALMICLQQ